MKRLAYLLIALVLLSSLVACSNSDPKDSNVTSESNPYTLTFWDVDSRDPWMVAYENFEKEFTNAYPYLTIEREFISGGDTPVRVQTAAASNTLPDNLNTYQMFHRIWAEQGLLQPIDEILDEIGRDNFSKLFLDMGTIDGKTYNIPYHMIPHIVFYRKDLYEKYNLSIPTTWDQWYENGKTIHENEPDVYGFLIYNDFPGQPYWLNNLMMCNNASAFDADGNVIINSPETIETLEFMLKISEMSPRDLLSKNQTDARLLLTQLQGAHLVDSTSTCNAIYEADVIEYFGAFVIPVMKGNSQAQNDYNGFAISRDANWDAASKWLRFWNTEENTLFYAQNTNIGHISTDKRATSNDAFWNSERIAPFKDIFAQGLIVSDLGVVGFMNNRGIVPYGPEVNSRGILVDMLNMMVLDNKTPQEVVTWAEAELKQVKEDVDGN